MNDSAKLAPEEDGKQSEQFISREMNTKKGTPIAKGSLVCFGLAFLWTLLEILIVKMMFAPSAGGGGGGVGAGMAILIVFLYYLIPGLLVALSGIVLAIASLIKKEKGVFPITALLISIGLPVSLLVFYLNL